MRKNSQNVAFDSMMEVIKEKFSFGGEVIISASGNSMYPLFRHQKDQVCLRSAEGEALKKYDMILYQRENGQYVLHRIVGIGEKGFVLRGDGQLENEYPIRAEQVIAKVARFTRNGKEYTCSHPGYRVYVCVWTHTVMLRKVWRKGKNLLWRVVNYTKKYIK